MEKNHVFTHSPGLFDTLGTEAFALERSREKNKAIHSVVFANMMLAASLTQHALHMFIT